MKTLFFCIILLRKEEIEASEKLRATQTDQKTSRDLIFIAMTSHNDSNEKGFSIWTDF